MTFCFIKFENGNYPVSWQIKINIPNRWSCKTIYFSKKLTSISIRDVPKLNKLTIYVQSNLLKAVFGSDFKSQRQVNYYKNSDDLPISIFFKLNS